jgi:hypothetical protein
MDHIALQMDICKQAYHTQNNQQSVEIITQNIIVKLE